jgi:hypothetical protein
MCLKRRQVEHLLRVPLGPSQTRSLLDVKRWSQVDEIGMNITELITGKFIKEIHILHPQKNSGYAYKFKKKLPALHMPFIPIQLL